MPRFITRVGNRALRAAGLERAGRTPELREALARAEQRMVELKRLVAQTHAEAQTWKTKLHEASTHHEQQRLADRATYEARVAKLEDRTRRGAERLEQRDAARQEKLNDLREKVVAADRSIRIGRDHLMAIEVKLDVVEGAVNVLDRRFRMIGRSMEQAGKRGL
jgi:chromosome segregation ATPase